MLLSCLVPLLTAYAPDASVGQRGHTSDDETAQADAGGLHADLPTTPFDASGFDICSNALAVIEALCRRGTMTTKLVCRAGLATVLVALRHIADHLMDAPKGAPARKNGEDMMRHISTLLRCFNDAWSDTAERPPDLLVEFTGVVPPRDGFSEIGLHHDGAEHEVLAHATVQMFAAGSGAVFRPAVSKSLDVATQHMRMLSPLAHVDERELVLGWLEVALVTVPMRHPAAPMRQYAESRQEVR